MGTFAAGHFLDPRTGRPVAAQTVRVLEYPTDVPLTPDGGPLATGALGGYERFGVADVDAVTLVGPGNARVDLVSIEKQMAAAGTSGSGILNVSGTVNLDDVAGIREVYATASATVEGVTLAAGDAAVFRYLSGAWTYMVVGEHTTWQTVPGAPPTDTTPPTGGTLTVSGTGDAGSTRTLTVTGASDETALHAQPYRFSTNGGTTWSTYQTSNAFTTAALAAGTYQPRATVRDAVGNTTVVSAADFTVTAAPVGPTWTTAIEDNFDRANANPLSNPSSGGQTWAGPLTNWRIESNMARAASGPTIHMYYDTGDADQAVEGQLTFTGTPGTESIDMCACVGPSLNTATFYIVQITNTNATIVGRNATGGGRTLPGGDLVHTFPSPVGVGTSPLVRGEFIQGAGSVEIKLYVGGVLIGTRTDNHADRASGTRVGLRGTAASVFPFLDNFKAQTA